MTSTAQKRLLPSSGESGDGSEAQMPESTNQCSVPKAEASVSLDKECLADISEICYGSINDVKARIQNCVTDPLNKSTSGEHFFKFKVLKKDGVFALETSAGLVVAIINTKTNHGLQSLVSIDLKGVRLEAFVPASDWNKFVHIWSKNKESVAIKVEISIYGYRHDAESVARVLADAGFILQQPRFESHDYFNFHSQPISDSLDDKGIMQTLVTQEAPKMGDSGIFQQNFLSYINKILDSVSHNDYLQEKMVDSRIITRLLRHQKQALDFIEQRETGNLSPSLSLWRCEDQTSKLPYYKHIISGARRMSPDDVKGGILADEMGLGKSLVMISTIVGSLDRANTFASSENDEMVPGNLLAVPSKATLVIVPSPLLLQCWMDQIQQHTSPSSLTIHKHHGRNKHSDKARLKSSEIVLTTYATLAVEYDRGNDILHQFRWFRIVIDEAHCLQNKSTKQFKAVSTLKAQHRWCLTGTPIRNSLNDLGTLVSFLRVPLIEDAVNFQNYTGYLNKNFSSDPFPNLRMLLKSICLRRTRTTLDLPYPVTELRRISFSAVERAEYEAMRQNCKQEFDKTLAGEVNPSIGYNTLKWILELRLFCNNGSVEQDSETNPYAIADEMFTYLQQNDQAYCVYCSCQIDFIDGPNDIGGAKLIGCPHLICENCTSGYQIELQTHRNEGISICPICLESNQQTCVGSDSERLHTYRLDKTHNHDRQLQHCDNMLSDRPYPSKLLALLEDLKHLQYGTKSVVFSYWKKTLDIAARLLDSNRMRFIRIDGSSGLTEKENLLRDFQLNGDVTILLTTLNGAIGYNLTATSKVYLLEPQWNISVENQAIARVVRLGQANQVTIIRYIMKDTIEETIQACQSRKLQLIDALWKDNKETKLISENDKAQLPETGTAQDHLWGPNDEERKMHIESLQTPSSLQIVSGEVGIIGRLFQSFIDLFLLLLRRAKQNSRFSQQQQHKLERRFHILHLWAHDHNVLSGRLDEVLQKSKDLRRTVLLILHSLSKTLSQRLITLVLPRTKARDRVLLESGIAVLLDESQVTISGTDYCCNDDAESNSEDFESSDLNKKIEDIILDIETFTECLADLNSCIQCPAPVPESNNRMPESPYIVERASLVTERVPPLEAGPIDKVRKADWDRRPSTSPPPIQRPQEPPSTILEDPASEIRRSPDIDQLIRNYADSCKKKRVKSDDRRRENVGPYKCTFGCDYHTKRAYCWKQHEESHQPQRFWLCHVCEQRNPSVIFLAHRRDKLLSHCLHMHPEFDAEIVMKEVGYKSRFEGQCDFCSSQFSSWDERLSHIQAHFEKHSDGVIAEPTSLLASTSYDAEEENSKRPFRERSEMIYLSDDFSMADDSYNPDQLEWSSEILREESRDRRASQRPTPSVFSEFDTHFHIEAGSILERITLEPYIFISHQELPVEASTIGLLQQELELHEWKDIRADKTGYFIIFENLERGRSAAVRCLETRHKKGILADVKNMELHQHGNPSYKQKSYLRTAVDLPSRNISRQKSTQPLSTPLVLSDSCPYKNCPQVFTGESRKGNMSRHIKNKHGASGRGSRQFPCADPGCEKTFKRKDARLNHERKEHPELGRLPAIPRKPLINHKSGDGLQCSVRVSEEGVNPKINSQVIEDSDSIQFGFRSPLYI